MNVIRFLLCRILLVVFFLCASSSLFVSGDEAVPSTKEDVSSLLASLGNRNECGRTERKLMLYEQCHFLRILD